MSIIETYPFSDTFNGLVNVSILRQEILDDVTPIPGLESVAALSGTQEILIQFTSALSGAEKTALDAVVAAHVGVDFAPREQTFQSLAIQDTSGSNPLTALSVTVGPTLPDTYRITAYCELRLQSPVSGGKATVTIEVAGSEAATTIHLDTDDWSSFATILEQPFDAGDDPAIEVKLTQSGAASTAEVRRIQVDFEVIDEGT